MTGNNNRYEAYEVDHTTFGGVICLSDFNTNFSGRENTKESDIAKRIIGDQNFDRQCRMTRMNQKKYGGRKNAQRNDETKI